MPDPNERPSTRHDLLDILLADRAAFVAVAQRVLRCRAGAEDVVQEAALRLWRAPPAPFLHNPAGYLRRMVHHLAIDVSRRIALETGRLAPVVAASDLASPCACPQDRMEACEALRAVMAKLGTAPERTRRAMLAHRLDGVPQKAIAARFGVSPSLINGMIRDATRLCRQALDEPVPAAPAGAVCDRGRPPAEPDSVAA